MMTMTRHGALAVVSGLDVTVERRWLKRLIALARAAAATESKLAWIARLLSRSPEPVILFTEFRHSLDAARVRLARRRTVATVHGGQRDAERHAELSAFLDGRASVLIATDVAGQGLNLQHRARWVINLELPWNPVRLEQRAGRVDRIGQRRAVHITSVVARHGAETGLLTRLARRVLAARRALDVETLPIAPPAAIAEPEIAGALLFGQPLPEPAVRQAPLCTRWRRHGRWLARTVTRRRAPRRRVARTGARRDAHDAGGHHASAVARAPRALLAGLRRPDRRRRRRDPRVTRDRRRVAAMRRRAERVAA